MKNTWIVHTIRFMELIMQIMVFAIVLMLLVMGFFGRRDMEALYCIIAAGVPVTLLFLVRSYVKSNVLTVLAHVLVLVFAVLFGRDGVEKAAFAIITAALIIYSVLLMTRGQQRFSEQMPLGMIILFIGALMICSYTEVLTVERWALYFGIVFIMLQIIYHNLENMHNFMLMNGELAGFPAKQLVSVNTFIMTIVLTVCAGIMVLSNNRYIYKMLRVLQGLLFQLVRFLFSLLTRGESIPEPEEIPTVEPEVGEEMELPWEATEGPWRDILNGLAIIIGVAALIAAVIGVSVAFMRLLRRMKGGSRLEGDIKEFVEPEGMESRRLKRREKADYESSDPKNVKARKLYKAAVKKNASRQGGKISGNMMPEEISRRYITAEADTVTEIYEKARYSNTEVTKEELELLKTVRKRK